MSKSTFSLGVALVAMVFAIFASFGGIQSYGAASGPAHMQKESFLQGLAIGARDQFSVTNAGVITTSGDITSTGGAGALVLTSSNTATSTATIGCVTTYATSTATPIRQMFFATSTLNIDGASITSGFGGTMRGIVLWGFGACP